MVRVVGACVFAIAAVGLVAFTTGWDGVRSESVLVEGKDVVTSSGVGFSIPVGWTGRKVSYWSLPLWIPLGDSADLARTDVVYLSGSVSDVPLEIVVTSFRRGGDAAESILDELQASSNESIDSAGGWLVVPKGESTTRSRVVLSGRRRGDVVLLTISSAVPIGEVEGAELAWRALKVTGVDMPVTY